MTPKSSRMINSRMKMKIRSRVCIQADCPWWLLGSDCESIRLRGGVVVDEESHLIGVARSKVPGLSIS